MSKVRYLCLDDEDTSTIRGPLDSITEEHPELEVSFLPPNDDYEVQVEELHRLLSAGDVNGLILDLRLDEGERKAKYRAPEIAQRLRNLSSEKGSKKPLPATPIVLWSTDERLKAAYALDDTSHDLFDLKILKGKLADDDDEEDSPNYTAQVARQLVALVRGYERLNASTSQGPERAFTLLRLEEAWGSRLDPNLFVPLFNDPSDARSIHWQARFIIRELLSIPNSGLITPEVTAARLGLDPNLPELEAVIDELCPNARYRGVFSEGWSCWWAPILENDWLGLEKCPGQLHMLPAAKRVEFINFTLDRNDLQPALQLNYTSSSSFWTICQRTGRPLDPIDGFATNRNLRSWQLTDYVSLYGWLNPAVDKQHIQLDPLEKQRIEGERELFSETRRRV